MTPSLVSPPTGKELIARVDTFLSRLYDTLDKVHVPYEEKLRNGGLPPTAVDQTGDTGVSSPQQFGDLSPPFSAPDRFTLGDTGAIIGDVSSAAAGVGAAWNDFGQKLKDNAARGRLSTQVAINKGELATLTKRRADVVAQKAGSGVVLGGKSPDEQISDLDKSIAALQQKIAQDEQELAAIKARS